VNFNHCSKLPQEDRNIYRRKVLLLLLDSPNYGLSAVTKRHRNLKLYTKLIVYNSSHVWAMRAVVMILFYFWVVRGCEP
jgi:hypothetical protein